MSKDAREGCSLSPILLASYAAWVNHRLSTLTSPDLAARSTTLFADDPHLSWELGSPDSLGFEVDCVRKTFRPLGDLWLTGPVPLLLRSSWLNDLG